MAEQIDIEDAIREATARDAWRADLTANTIAEHVESVSRGIATAFNLPLVTVHTRLVQALRERLQLEPATSLDNKRTARWRVRVQLYDAHDELQADSDDDLPLGQIGKTVIAGLPAVAEHLAALALRFHASTGGQCIGLEQDVLLHRLKALRPTLSRRGGNGTWRVPYKVSSENSIHRHQVKDWLARVDVERVESKGDDNGQH